MIKPLLSLQLHLLPLLYSQDSSHTAFLLCPEHLFKLIPNYVGDLQDRNPRLDDSLERLTGLSI